MSKAPPWLWIGLILIGFGWPLYAALAEGGDLFRKRRGRNTHAGFGVFGVLTGLIVGVLAPNYLDVRGWTALGLQLLGGALAFAMGLGGLLSSRVGEIGYSIGMTGMAAVLHVACLSHRALLGRDVTLKIGALAALGLGALFLARGLITPLGRGWRKDATQRAAAVVGAVLELIALGDILFNLWEKYVR